MKVPLTVHGAADKMRKKKPLISEDTRDILLVYLIFLFVFAMAAFLGWMLVLARDGGRTYDIFSTIFRTVFMLLSIFYAVFQWKQHKKQKAEKEAQHKYDLPKD